MFIRLKDNSPMPSCAIWLGDSLIKPAEDSGGKITSITFGSGDNYTGLTRNQNEIVLHDSGYDRYYTYVCFTLNVKNMKGQDITLLFKDLAISPNNDSVLVVGEWDRDYTDQHEGWIDEQWARKYRFWQPDNTEGQESPTKGIVPAPEDNNEHYVQIWMYSGYFGFSAGNIVLCPASLVEGVQSRFTADGYYQTYENEKYVRTVKLVEEVKQQDGTWKKDGYEIEGDIDLEYDGKVWAYWTDPKTATANMDGKQVEAPITVTDGTYFKKVQFSSGVTSIDYIDEKFPIYSCDNMFEGCSNITEVPYFNTSIKTSAESMFEGCVNLEKIPVFNFKSPLDVYRMFMECEKLKEIAFEEMTEVVSPIRAFYACASLEKVNNINTSKAISFSYMFYACKNLYSIPDMDLSSAKGDRALYAIFGVTPYLTDINFVGSLNCNMDLYDSHLTQRSIKDLIRACAATTNTDAKTLTFKADTVFINDEPDTYTPLINQAIESGWTFSNLNIVEPADVVGFKYTTTDGRKYNTTGGIDFTSGYTNSCQTDGKNGMVLWNGAKEVNIYIVDWNNTGNLKTFDGFINKTRFVTNFRIATIGNGDDARWDFTNADFSGATLNEFGISMHGCSQDGIYNLDLSGFDCSRYGTCVNGCETKNLRLVGSLDYSFSFNMGYSLNKESIKSILQACANSQNTDAKTLHTDVTLQYLDTDGSLTELLNQAIAKGWSLEGIQIVAKENAICLSYTTTDGQIPQKFIDQGNGRTVITSEYGKYYLIQPNDINTYNLDWNDISTLKTFDGADKEFKCRSVCTSYCPNLVKFDSKNIKYYNDKSGWNPERWRKAEKLKECINLDFTEYTGQDINSMFAECWGKVPEVRFVGSINNTIDFRDAGDAFTYNTILNILTACAATTNTDAKRCIFNNAEVTNSKELSAKMAECTEKGWTFEGLTLKTFKMNFSIVSGDTWNNSAITAYDEDDNIITPISKAETYWEYDFKPARFSSDLSSASNISTYDDTTAKAKWTDTSYLFADAQELLQVYLNNMDTSECIRMENMFENCARLTNVDMIGLDFSNVSTTEAMFAGCTNLHKIKFYQADFSNVSNYTDMFKGCTNLEKIILKDSNKSTYDKLSDALTEAGLDPAIIVTGATYANYIYADPLEDEARADLYTDIKIGADIKFRVTGRNADKHCGAVWAGNNGNESSEERLFSYATNMWMFDCGNSRIEMNIADARPDYGDGSLLDFTCGNNYMIDNISGRKYTNDSGVQTDFDDVNFEINLKTFYTNSLQIWKNDVLVFDAHVTDDDRFIDNITGTDVPNSQNYQFKKFLD